MMLYLLQAGHILAMHEVGADKAGQVKEAFYALGGLRDGVKDKKSDQGNGDLG